MSNLNTQWDINHRDDIIERCAPNGRGLPCTSLRIHSDPPMSDQALDAYPAFKARCEEAIVMLRAGVEESEIRRSHGMIVLGQARALMFKRQQRGGV